MNAAVRKPRFRRKRSAGPRNFQVTERDEEILLIVARHKIARSTHIIALLQAQHPGASEQQILRRLEWLYHKQYLSRPLAQLESYRAGAGSRPIAYMLGNQGADLLAAKYGWRRTKVDWTAKARTAKRGNIEHAIEITDFMVTLDLTCRRRGTHAVMYFDEILRELAPEATREAPRPYHWPVSTTWQGSAQTLYVIPDQTFGIRDLTRRGDRAVKFFAYERDRAIEKHFPRGTVLCK